MIANSEEEMARVTGFIDRARASQPKFHYQRNTIYLRFCHADYHKGAALAELSRLTEIPRDLIFAAGDHHNDISMLDGRYAQIFCVSGQRDSRGQRGRPIGVLVTWQKTNSAPAFTRRCGISSLEALDLRDSIFRVMPPIAFLKSAQVVKKSCAFMARSLMSPSRSEPNASQNCLSYR